MAEISGDGIGSHLISWTDSRCFRTLDFYEKLKGRKINQLKELRLFLLHKNIDW